MFRIMSRSFSRAKLLCRGQQGITGLETAIVLIAFVVVSSVVSSVFAFAALSTGLFSSDKAKETIQAGLAETRGSMELKGSVIVLAETFGTTAAATSIAFQVANAAGGESIDLTPGKTLIKYTDSTQSKMFLTNSGTEGFTSTGLGSADSDMLLERNEVYEIKMTGLESTGSGTNNLTTALGVDTTFSLEVIPPKGAVLFIERSTPIYWNTANSLN